MIRAGLAIIWASIWTRHRSGLLASGLGLVVVAFISPLVFKYIDGRWALTLTIIPLISIYGFVLNALLVVDDAGSLSSGNPRHRFPFPVKTSALVFWPMLCGGLAAAVLWVVTATLIYRPAGFSTPVALPAVAMAALMVAIQAVSWLPIRNEWVRMTVTVVGLGTLAGVPLWLMRSVGAPDYVVAAMLLGYMAVAYVVALMAVEGDRRGETWRVWPEVGSARDSRAGATATRSRRPFRSAAAAQFWYEWRCHGLALPITMVIILTLITGLLGQAAVTTQRPLKREFLPVILAMFALMPLFLAGSIGPALGRLTSPFKVKPGPMITFLAIRPVESADVAMAKFRMAFATAVCTWGVILVFWAIWLATVGRPLGLTEAARAALTEALTRRGILGVASTNALIVALTWKQLTGGLWAPLSGRGWIADCMPWFYTTAIIAAVAAGLWVMNDDVDRWLAIVPALAAMVLILKLGVAAVAIRASLARDLLGGRQVAGMVAVWIGLTALGYFTMSSITPARFVLPAATTIAAIAAVMPLSRFALATLAFDWNRHR